MVSGILRLSTKYLIDSLRAKALAHLSLAWPSDLKTWDLREDICRGFEIEGTSGSSHRYPHPFVRVSLFFAKKCMYSLWVLRASLILPGR